jgi:primosomal protein N' (replication factor Y) (superfamily II helicase)
MMKFANILFQQKTGDNCSILTYEIPEDMGVVMGQSVKVPIRGKDVFGIVWEIHNTPPSFKTRPIKEINYEKPLLSPSQIDLIKWMHKYYFCPLDRVLKLFIPTGILKNKKFRDSAPSSKKIVKSSPLTLTPAQNSTFDTIIKSPLDKFLIHGVTGSGKTEIYKSLAHHYISENKQVLILVPEISLTPQIIEYFESALNIEASVIHSKISEVARRRAWLSIWKNESKLIIGSRSAIFSPFRSLGLVIVDEEHELSYKQEQAPRYDIHSVIDKMLEINKNAAMREKTSSNHLKVVFGSATPSIETAEKLEKSTFRINERIGDSVMPDMEVVDMREEFKKRNHSIFSDRLREELNRVLKENKQAILFLNRRGSASSVVCRDCGENEKCEKCEIPMTYHKSTVYKETLICHHCGKISSPPVTCKNCGGVNIRFLGIGTQKVEEEVLKEFPDAKVLRADRDNTSGKDDFEKIYRAFKNQEANILVGTQMVAKGLHLPKVTLVGVILADIGINMPDFRAAERNFQLITQVAGRAGRSNEKGKVIIQTYNPEHVALLCAKEQDYDKFFSYERTQRKILKNPPFSKLIKILVEDPSLTKCKSQSEKIERALWQIAREDQIAQDIEINIYPAYLSKLRGKFRYVVLIKTQNTNILLNNLLEKIQKEDIIAPNTKIDVDPISTI